MSTPWKTPLANLVAMSEVIMACYATGSMQHLYLHFDKAPLIVFDSRPARSVIIFLLSPTFFKALGIAFKIFSTMLSDENSTSATVTTSALSDSMKVVMPEEMKVCAAPSVFT